MVIRLEAQVRIVKKKKCRSLRAQNIIPGQIYNLQHNTDVQFEEKALENTLKQAGKTSLIEISIEGKVYNVLAKETQYSLNRQRVTYADFYEVDMNKKIITTVPIKCIGENYLIDEKGAILVSGASSIEVEVLPGNIPKIIEVDISIIKNFSDSIKAKNIALPEGINLAGNADTMIATCAETRITRQKDQAEKAVLTTTA